MLTDDEVALYDRQLRLWGVEAQKRLNNARVLIIGMSGLGAEVAKNIILGGVKSVTLMDNKNVTEQDASSQFLVSRDSIGHNRAGASLARAQLLNPMVDVMASSSSLDEKKDQFFTEFTVICAIGCTKTQIARLNRIARSRGIKFFASAVFGFTSYIFCDLGELHSYTREIVTIATKDRPESSRVITGSIKFGPFQDIVDINWNGASDRMMKKTNAWVHPILVLLEFVEKFKRQPSPSTRNSDFQELIKIRDNYIEKHGIDYERVDDSLFGNVFGELGPVCAVTGGVLSQEIVKAVSQKDEPISNLFIYNPVLGTGVVEKFTRHDTPVLYQDEIVA